MGTVGGPEAHIWLRFLLANCVELDVLPLLLWWGADTPRLTVALQGRPLHTVSTEDVHIHQLGGAHELKLNVAHLVQRVHCQTTLLLQLPVGRGDRRRMERHSTMTTGQRGAQRWGAWAADPRRLPSGVNSPNLTQPWN